MKPIITTAFFIAPIVLIVFSRPVQGLGVLEALQKVESRLLKLGKVSIKNLLLGAFIKLGGGLMAPTIAAIYLLDPKGKVEGSFGLCGNGFLNGLLSSIFSTAILLGLGIDRKPQAITKQAD